MTRNKRFLLLACSCFLLPGVVRATDIAYSGTFIGSEGPAKGTGITANKTYTRDMNTTGDRVSFQIVYSTYTLAVSTSFSSLNYTPTITISGNNFTTGLQVLLSSGAVPAIGGLTLGTTYFVSVINPNTVGVGSSFKLSLTSTGAVAGLGLVLTSTTTASNRYTLAPLAFTNTSGGLQLQWSDDNVTFFNATTGNYGATISSVTFVTAGGSTLYDLGPIQHRYLRLNETAPTTGAISYTATDNERYSFKH